MLTKEARVEEPIRDCFMGLSVLTCFSLLLSSTEPLNLLPDAIVLNIRPDNEWIPIEIRNWTVKHPSSPPELCVILESFVCSPIFEALASGRSWWSGIYLWGDRSTNAVFTS
jgi:hypothetical protein